MYKKVCVTVENLLRRKGSIAFALGSRVPGWFPSFDFKRYVATYVYASGTKPDILADFHLVKIYNKRYHVGALRFVKECRPSLKNLMLHLVVECLIQEANMIAAKELTIVTRDASIVDVLLDLGFGIREASADHLVYKGSKSL